MPYVLHCECGWEKEYRNPVAAKFGGEAHIPHCPFYRRAKEMIDTMSMKRFEGKTEDAGGAILSAAFWKQDTVVRGTIVREFDTENGKCYVLDIPGGLTVDGSALSPKQEGSITGTRFSLGGLKGFQMAVDASGAGRLLVGDVLTIKATGLTDTGKGSPQVNFRVRIERGDDKQ